MTTAVRDLMTRKVVTVTPDTDFKQVATLLRAYNIGSVPVVDHQDHVIGIVSEADIIAKAGWTAGSLNRLERVLLAEEVQKAAAHTAGEAMNRGVVTIEPAASVDEAARVMLTRRVKTLPVVDGGKLVGILSRADIVKAYARTDADLRSEIVEDVLRDRLWLAEREVTVDVESGRVALRGRVESRSLAEIAGHLVAAVTGVVSVQNDLTWDVDDRRARLAHEPAQDLSYSGPSLR